MRCWAETLVEKQFKKIDFETKHKLKFYDAKFEKMLDIDGYVSSKYDTEDEANFHGMHKSFSKWCRKNDAEIKDQIQKVGETVEESEHRI